MNKTSLKFLSIVILALVFIYGFSASYTSDSIDNISYVIALAVDLCDDEKNLQVTFEFMDTSSFSSEKSSNSSEAIIDTVNATSINSAINLLNAYVGKEVNLSHCKVIVFSDKLARKGISSEVTELMNNIQIRPSTNIIICKGNSLEYIQNSTSDLEKILTKYYDIFPNSSEYTGYTSNIMIGNFYNYLTTQEAGNLAILGSINPKLSSSSSENDSKNSGESSKDSSNNSSEDKESNDKPNNNISISNILSGNAPIQGERGTENIGLAVLKEGKYIGNLTAADTLCHTLISGEVNSFLLTINNKEIYKDYIDISLFENTPAKVIVKIENDTPIIIIKLELIGRISGIKKGINYSNESNNINLDELSKAVNKQLKNYLITYLNKTSSEYKCDIDYFYNLAKRNFLTLNDWQEYDWASKYENSKFEISINSNIYYSLIDSN